MRRAFAMPMVIMLALVSALAVAVMLQRQDAQMRTVQAILDGYTAHHSAFGVRAVVRKWLTMQKADDLSELAGTGGVAHRFALPDDVFVSVRVADGQGLPSVRTESLGALTLDYYTRVRERVEAIDPGLLRDLGPPLISINAAPAEVLGALIEDEDEGPRLADRFIKARERKPLTRDDTVDLLRRAGIEDVQQTQILALLTFEPSLWRLEAAVQTAARPEEVRRFDMLVEVGQGGAKVHRWTEVIQPTPGEEVGGDGGGAQGEPGRGEGGRVRESGSAG